MTVYVKRILSKMKSSFQDPNRFFNLSIALLFPFYFNIDQKLYHHFFSNFITYK